MRGSDTSQNTAGRPPRRKRIDTLTEADVLRKSARRCCLCFGVNHDFRQKRGQLAHLDRDPMNSSRDNLAFLCLEHHDEYDSMTSESKNYTLVEVKCYRSKLYREIIDREPSRQIEWAIKLEGRFSEFNSEKVKAYTADLQSLLGDQRLTIKRINEGSVILQIRSSEKAFAKMRELVESGRVHTLLGHRIEGISRELRNHEMIHIITPSGSPDWDRER
jgi:hypothetical protein